MQRAFVESTTLRSAGHDAQTAVLELQFQNGAVYHVSAGLKRPHFCRF
jgi:KTSC domain